YTTLFRSRCRADDGNVLDDRRFRSLRRQAVEVERQREQRAAASAQEMTALDVSPVIAALGDGPVAAFLQVEHGELRLGRCVIDGKEQLLPARQELAPDLRRLV